MLTALSVTLTVDEVETSALLEGYVITLNTVAPLYWLNYYYSLREDMKKFKTTQRQIMKIRKRIKMGKMK